MNEWSPQQDHQLIKVHTRGAAGQLSPGGQGRGSLTATQVARGERRGKSGSGADGASGTIKTKKKKKRDCESKLEAILHDESGWRPDGHGLTRPEL